LTAPVLAVAGFMLLAVLPYDREAPGTLLLLPQLQSLRDGSPAPPMLSAGANWSQTVWLVALAATGLAVFAAAGRRTRLVGLLPALAGAAIAVATVPDTLAKAAVVDSRASEVICTDDEPQVCTARLSAHLLDPLTPSARQALSILEEKLPPAPTRVQVGFFDDRRPDSPLPTDALYLSGQFSTDTPYDDLLWIMLDGAGAPPCDSLAGQPTSGEAGGAASSGNGSSPVGGSGPGAANPNIGDLAARLAAAAWLLDRDLPREFEDRPEVALAREALSTLRRLPSDEQQARVTALRDAELTCAVGDRLDLLMGTSGAP
jgi:hypothetical protein